MTISIIVAADENNVIGGHNKLLWHLPDDFKRMKELTMGYPLIMGRKTYESIGRALPGRRNIVITSQKITYPGCEVVPSLEEALKAVEHDPSGEAFIFGGGDVYRQALPMTDRVYMTRVHGQLEGDVTFPELPADQWTLTASEKHEKDERHVYAFTFETWERKRQ